MPVVTTVCARVQLQAGFPVCDCVFGLVGVPVCARMCGYSGRGPDVPPPQLLTEPPLSSVLP